MVSSEREESGLLKNTVLEAMTAADIMTAVQIPIMEMVFLFFILWLHSCGKIYRLSIT